jgi:hypothetical protein
MVVRQTEAVFKSYAVRDGCVDGAARGLLLVYDAAAGWEYCVAYHRKGLKLRLAHISAASASVGPGGYCSPRRPMHFEPYILELNDTLRRPVRSTTLNPVLSPIFLS